MDVLKNKKVIKMIKKSQITGKPIDYDLLKLATKKEKKIKINNRYYAKKPY